MIEKLKAAIAALNDLLTADETCSDPKRVARVTRTKLYLLSWLAYIETDNK